jgi:hypothetical protein
VVTLSEGESENLSLQIAVTTSRASAQYRDGALHEDCTVAAGTRFDDNQNSCWLSFNW